MDVHEPAVEFEYRFTFLMSTGYTRMFFGRRDVANMLTWSKKENDEDDTFYVFPAAALFV
jgi:hypothetical protein